MYSSSTGEWLTVTAAFNRYNIDVRLLGEVAEVLVRSMIWQMFGTDQDRDINGISMG
jgi:hypothetical protein